MKMVMKIVFAIAGVLALTAVGGCAAAPSGAAAPAADGSAVTAGQATRAAHAECLVCKYDADLACVNISVASDTPSTKYDGKTYYFCSDSCCKKFEKEPAKYVNQK